MWAGIWALILGINATNATIKDDIDPNLGPRPGLTKKINKTIKLKSQRGTNINVSGRRGCL